MARVCVDPTFFEVDGTGQLTMKRGVTGLRQILAYRNPGIYTFTKASYPGLTRLRVRVVGGGGGGAGAQASTAGASAGNGGGGGAYSESLLDASVLGTTETISVGAGGAGSIGNTPSDAGGASSFGGHVVAPGGLSVGVAFLPGTTPGVSSSSSLSSLGTGQITVAGSRGTSAIRLGAGMVQSGGGGNAGGGMGAGGRSFTGTVFGQPGSQYGGGGGGASANGADSNYTAQTGGSGASGVVILDLYF